VEGVAVYEITLTVSRVKEEHVSWTVKALEAFSHVLALEGTDIGIDISVEKDRDGVERFAEFYRTKTGKVLIDDDVQALADEAERGYDVEHLREKT
jgi:hypothetical protein